MRRMTVTRTLASSPLECLDCGNCAHLPRESKRPRSASTCRQREWDERSEQLKIKRKTRLSPGILSLPLLSSHSPPYARFPEGNRVKICIISVARATTDALGTTQQTQQAGKQGSRIRPSRAPVFPVSGT